MNTARQTPEGWHRADVKALVAKTFGSFAAIDRMLGLAYGSARDVLRRKWGRLERLIADRAGVPPWEIWPERYRDAAPRPARSGHDRRAGRERRATIVKPTLNRKSRSEVEHVG